MARKKGEGQIHNIKFDKNWTSHVHFWPGATHRHWVNPELAECTANLVGFATCNVAKWGQTPTPAEAKTNRADPKPNPLELWLISTLSCCILWRCYGKASRGRRRTRQVETMGGVKRRAGLAAPIAKKGLLARS